MSSDAGKKAYVVAMVIQVIYTGMYVVSKAALDGGMNSFVFIFYRQAAATLLLVPLAIILERRNAPPMSLWLFTKIFLYALLGSTVSMNLHNLSLKYTSATVASATSNSIPVITFLFAVLLHLEAIKLRASSGVAKLAGVALCIAGVLVIALYAGPPLSPLNHHRAFAGHAHAAVGNKQGQWMKGTFLMLLANVTWSLWIVLQARLLKEYPNKLLVTALQCLLSTAQSLALAAAATAGRRDVWRLRLDVGLVAVAYSGFVVTGVSFYLQAWCIEKRGPVFLAMSNPLGLLLTVFCSSFFLGEVVHLGSILGGALLVAGLYSVLWGKSKELPPPPSPCLDHASAIICTVKQGSAASDGDMNMDGVKLEEKRIKLDSQV
ncbi:WAT1-related protein At5g64700 [Lolium perenne]|uniref:WAT1-related protein At5g64700 n=1 Tax=Lolium perenne TaxID=4522 RepID=UPI0021EB4025|nr:WAT1-related protein At5g64700-like [Lolium perenne]